MASNFRLDTSSESHNGGHMEILIISYAGVIKTLAETGAMTAVTLIFCWRLVCDEYRKSRKPPKGGK